MEFSESSRPKINRLEALIAEISECTHMHVISPDKIDIVQEDVDEGLGILKELNGFYGKHIVCCDIPAISHLQSLRRKFKDAKNDLACPWNQKDLILAEEDRLRLLKERGYDITNPNVIHGVMSPLGDMNQ